MAQEMIESGDDGWVFLAGGSNPFLTYLRGIDEIERTVLDDWRALLESRRSRLAGLGIRYQHVFAPEKSTIYADRLCPAGDRNRSHIARLNTVAGGMFLDLVPYFLHQRDALQLYHRTDSHWNFYGAFSAFQLLGSDLGFRVPESILRAPVEQIEVMWDLGSKLSPPQTERSEIRDVLVHARRVWVNQLVEIKEASGNPNEGRLHVGSVAVFRNPQAVNRQRVVIFGDSFSEYRPHLLTAMFAEAFEEVHFVWSSSIDFDYVDLVRPDLVVTELAERFMRIVPKDEQAVAAIVHRQLDAYGQPAEDSRATPSRDFLSGLRSSLTRRTRPDIVLAGAMKCGTTILHDFLLTHENIQAAKNKEIHYFSLNYALGDVWYEQFFPERRTPQSMLLDASPTYFDMTFGAALPALIRRECPEARVIVCLRDPVARAISHFRHLQQVVRSPDLVDLKLEDVFSGDLIHRYWTEFSMNRAGEELKAILDFGVYSRRLAAYQQVFRADLLVIRNEDLWSDPDRTMDRVFRHLGLDRPQNADFQRRDYVTRDQPVPDSVEQALRRFYAGELERLGQEFGISFSD